MRNRSEAIVKVGISGHVILQPFLAVLFTLIFPPSQFGIDAFGFKKFGNSFSSDGMILSTHDDRLTS